MIKTPITKKFEITFIEFYAVIVSDTASPYLCLHLRYLVSVILIFLKTIKTARNTSHAIIYEKGVFALVEIPSVWFYKHQTLFVLSVKECFTQIDLFFFVIVFVFCNVLKITTTTTEAATVTCSKKLAEKKDRVFETDISKKKMTFKNCQSKNDEKMIMYYHS